ncbi:hypothetical protein Tco_0817696 [Tanacetum coccineum]
MGNQSQKKSIMDQFESVDEIRVYKGNSHDCDVECDKLRDGASSDTSLDFTPTIINEDGGEFAIFDDEIVAKDMEHVTLNSEIMKEWRIAKGPWITKEGISALASSLGKPIRMDNTAAQICKDGKGSAEYARVLVEFDVNKGFKDEICVQYKSKDNVIKGTKKVKENGKKKESIDVKDVDGFTEVKHKKNNEFKRNDGFGGNQWREGKRNVWNRNGTYKKKKKEVVSNDEEQMKKKGSNVSDKGKDCTIQDVADKALRNSQNKFASLKNLSEKQELNLLKDRIIVDQYLNKKLQPTCVETNNWSKDMI